MEWIIALISSIAGVIVGFLLTNLSDARKEKRLKHGLAVILSHEIKELLQNLCADYDAEAQFIMIFEKAKQEHFVSSTPSMSTMQRKISLVYKNNLDKLGLLEPEVISKIISLYDYLENVRADSYLLAKEFSDFYRSINRDALVNQMSDQLLRNEARQMRAISLANGAGEALCKTYNLNGGVFDKLLPKSNLNISSVDPNNN